jgi:pantoate--beta-alanine ligase
VEQLSSAEGVRSWAAGKREQGRKIGLVPTMGAFHDGHLSLMSRARRECDEVIVYLFLNPLQFGASEDLERYPRNPRRDRMLAQVHAADVFFTPTLEDMYPYGYPPPASRIIHPGPTGQRYEGEARPGHFDGVLTVVDRLLGIVGGCRAYFGEKDAQQLFLINQMAVARHPEVQIVPCETVREEDGLAMSSRNSYLSVQERSAAFCLSRGLFAARELFTDGARDAGALRTAVEDEVRAEPLAALDYAAVVEEASFEPVETVERDVRLLVAARVGETRLIDNLLLPLSLG